MITRRMDLPRDTLDLLVLRALALEAQPQHGWAVSHRIHQVSGNTLLIQQGSLYPSLHRLEGRGWIKAKWGWSENNRRAKYYKLTKTGQKQLQEEKDSWGRLATAIAQILKTT